MSSHWSCVDCPSSSLAGPPGPQRPRSVGGSQLLLRGLRGDGGPYPGWTHLLHVSLRAGHHSHHEEQRWANGKGKKGGEVLGWGSSLGVMCKCCVPLLIHVKNFVINHFPAPYSICHILPTFPSPVYLSIARCIMYSSPADISPPEGSLFYIRIGEV